MRRLLRAVAALALVPLVVFSNPGTASAATSGVLTFNLDGGSNDDAVCVLSWARTTTGISIGASSRCDGGPDYTPYFGQAFEGTTGSYGMVFKNSAGTTCGSSGLPARDIEDNDVQSVAAGLGAAFAPITWSSCVPVTACLSYYWDPPTSPFNLDTVDCVPFPVDAPVVDPPWEPPVEMKFGYCDLGTPEGGSYDHRQTYVDAQSVKYVKDKLRLLFNERSTIGVSWTAAEREWRLDVIHSANGVPPSPANATASGLNVPAGSENQPTTTDATGNTMNPTWVNDELWINNPSGLPGSHTEKVPPYEIYGMQVTTRGPLSTANIPIGYTNPSKCTFWLGPQIRATDHPTFGYARPWGKMIDEGDYVEPEPDPEPPVVAPTPTDQPDTDLGLLGAILAVLRSLWNAIKAIATSILDGLKELFIPDRSSWGWSELKDQFKSKPPFSIMQTTYDEARAMSNEFKAAGGCGDFPSFEIDGYDSRFTCARLQSGGMGSLYNVVSLGLISLTGISLFMMVSGYFEKNG